jgi:CRISPR-associated protein Csb2
MATIRITLLSGRYGATPWNRSEHEGQVEYPPSPWRLLRAVLHGGFLLSDTPGQLPGGLPELIELLGQTPPSYHLPFGEYGQIRGFRPHFGRERVPPLDSGGLDKRRSFIDSYLQLGVGAAIHVHFPVELNPKQERLLEACLAGLSYLGRAEYTAVWQVVPTMPAANCSADGQGSISVLCGEGEDLLMGLLMNAQDARNQGRQNLPGQRWRPFLYEPKRPVMKASGTSWQTANRALFAFLPGHDMPSTAGLAWTDRLHRALLKRAPSSSMFAGLAGGQPLPEHQRAWYLWHETRGVITALEVVAPQPFSEMEIEALQRLQVLYARGGTEVPLRLMKLDHDPVSSLQQLRTSTPMLLYTTPREGKLQRSPAGQAIQSLLWGLGEQGKLDPGQYSLQGEMVVVEHPDHGRIAAQVLEVVDDQRITGRGDRKAASSLAFHVQICSDQPLRSIGIGWGRHFGAGRLEAVA